MPVWLLLSLAAHFLVFVWVASEVGMVLVKRPDGQAQLTVRPEVAAMLKSHMDEQRLPSLREKVETLAALRNEIADERNRRLEQLKELAAQKGQELPQLLEETLSGIVESEQRALAQAAKVNEELQKTEALRTELQAATQKDALGEAAQKAAALNGQLSAVAGIQQSASNEQNRALGLMRDAASLVEWVGGAQATSLWVKAGAAEEAAGQAMGQAQSALASHRKQVAQDTGILAESARAAEQAAARLSQAQARQKQAVADAQSAAFKAGYALSNAQARAADAAQKAADSRLAASQAASRAQGAAQALAAAGAQAAASGAAEDKRIAESLKPASDRTATDAAARQKAADAAGKAAAKVAAVEEQAAAVLTKKQRGVTEAGKPAEFTAQEQASIGAARTTANRLALLALSPARGRDAQHAARMQQAATAALTAAAGAIRGAARGKQAGDFYDHEIAAAKANGLKLHAGRLDAAQAYQAARNIELEIAGLYREARAAELAMLQSTPMSAALANTQTPVPDHTGVDEAVLAGGGKNVQDLRQYKAALGAATREMTAMTSAAASMRNTLASSSFSGAGEGLQVGWTNILAQSTNLRALTGMASEGGGPVQDLTAAMAAMEAKMWAGHGDGGHGIGQGAAGGVGDGKGGGGGSGGRGGKGVASPYPPGRGNFFGASGNEVGPQGQPAKWFYVGSWYVIGPFPNEGRKNIETVFPPESVIDLNAVYTGTGGKPVSWEYVNAPSCQIVPPDMREYAIYYAWTEIKMDRDRDLWIATGSDDRSDVWVNDIPVWHTGNWLKTWNMTEAYRKVHFRKGRNKILVRLENGWGICGFSVLVDLEEA